MKKPNRSGASAPVGQSLKMKTPHSKKTKIICICNQKGGCGKTTSVVNISASLAYFGFKTLVIDLDAQCNATSGLGLNLETNMLSVFDLLIAPHKNNPKDAIFETKLKNLFVLPASIELSEFESCVASEIGRENKLKKLISQFSHEYDYIFIDTPPSLGLLSINALNASDEVFIAMQTHPFAFDGLNLLLDTISLIKEELNSKVEVSGIMVTMFDKRTKISFEILNRIKASPELKDLLFQTIIRQNIKLAESSNVGKPVLIYAPSSYGTADYLNLAQEILKKHKFLIKKKSMLKNDDLLF